MIDAARFATLYTAFWSMATPTCEHFVRKLNAVLYERIFPPLNDTDTKDRAFIAEVAFALFVAHAEGRVAGQPKTDIEAAAEGEARRRLLPFLRQGFVLPAELGRQQMDEAWALSGRLSSYFDPALKNLIVHPIFSGCGLVDRSEGDVIWGTGLYEVKTVDRPFRSNDVRQLLVYAALNHLAGEYEIGTLGVFNPRRGVSFEVDVEEAVWEVSGRPPSSLYEEIAQVVASGEISH